MSLKTRGSGFTTRGSGGGGSITVNDHTGEAVSTGVRTLQWNTLDKYGFTATVDPDDPTKVLIGDAPVFADKLQWSNTPTVLARVSESDPLEADAFDDGGFANTNQPTTNDSTPSFTSSIGRGFGADASLKVIIKHSDTVVEDTTFTCNGNGNQTTNGVNVNIANYESDGDGSAFKGRFTVTTDLLQYLTPAQSGKFNVTLTFTEQKWGESVTLNQTFFYDNSSTTPIITGSPSVIEHPLSANRVTKFLSGIQYFTTGNPFQVEVPNINDHNDDTSHPTASLSLESGDFGITPYASSPWVNNANWSKLGNQDTSQDFVYNEDRAIDINNFRHVGSAKIITNIRDSFNTSSNVDTNSLEVCIDTVNRPSTDLVEYFDSENKRLSNNDLTSSWDSEDYCSDGDMVVFGGRAYQGSDLPTITRSVQGSLGSVTSLSTFLPSERVDGSARLNPNYKSFSSNGVFWRKFIPANTTASYAGMTMNILTNGSLSSKLSSGDIKIFIWKLGSIDTSSPNLILPTSYDPDNPSTSLSNSLWGYSNYDFGAFDEGVSQTAAGSGIVTNIAGNLVSMTFSGYNVVSGVLVRLEVKKGTYLEEVSVSFI